MHRPFLKTAALTGALSVALGAFAAHGLKQFLPPAAIQVFETGVRYQFYHVFALLAVGILYQQGTARWLRWSGNLFISGMIVFSGSLYLLCLLPARFSWVGAITPLGGVALIAGWVCMLLAFTQRR